MLIAVVLALCGILAFSPQVVLSRFNTIKFSSIQQCGPFSVTFSGGNAPTALPLTLTVVPFNSTPISITIPEDSWNATTSTGAAVTFLPLPAGSTFVASLDDADGHPTGLVSDVIAIENSSDTSCLPPQAAATTPPFAVDTSTFSQCAPFNVSYDAAAGVGVPKVRGFIPRGFSLYMAQNSTDEAASIATYTMEAFRGLQIALLMDDGKGHRQTTAIQSVLGDSTSSAKCIHVNVTQISSNTTNAMNSSQMMTTEPTTSVKLSKGAIIAITVVSVALVAGVLILMGLYVYRERKRRRALRAQADVERQSRYEKPGELDGWETTVLPRPLSTDKSHGRPSSIETSNVPRKNPIYVTARFDKSPTSPEFIQYAVAETGPTANSGTWPPLQSAGVRSLAPTPSQRSKRRPSVQTLRSLDIEQILARATIYEEDRQRGEREQEEVALSPRKAPSPPPPALKLDSPPRKDTKLLNVPRSPAYSLASTSGGQSAVDVPYTPASNYTRMSAASPWMMPPSRAKLADEGARTSYSGTAL
ncbi:hypothetical protein GLOTRDRAFT_133366 [Gloeophyllum trabeum ATCC 11539]|uniref:Dystroglycan-type cadherin-like domain-containing protein n=1 Tax=Gloeophyllum trabeum (strain ATCC 11539 / FP-39264 / Madison 617) TaxID=670483 RepID=S7PUT5_GLOTA|nr:uncharacterized protein GLOTRDRAFT_133366 [Gloeophyllum trabeum ATCC 11539]EPQ51173.1 hypothetical protein GLOTRDRAFT_133366 [Gloeophyllum trabeum ATCC 11539]